MIITPACAPSSEESEEGEEGEGEEDEEGGDEEAAAKRRKLAAAAREEEEKKQKEEMTKMVGYSTLNHMCRYASSCPSFGFLMVLALLVHNPAR